MPSIAHIIRRRHNRKRNRRKQSMRSTVWLSLLLLLPTIAALAPVLALLGVSVWLYASAASHLPTPPATVFLGSADAGSRFYDRTGRELLYSINDPLGADRRWLPLDAYPAALVDAALLAEDPDHLTAAQNFDPLSTLVQLWSYIIGLPLEADSSLAANLVRDTILPLAQSSGLDESLLEIVLTAESRRLHSAEQLLEWRLNSAYYGRDAYGIDAAAQVYLGKPAESLTLAESTLLAAIVTQPSLNPIDAELTARERGADLLFDMLNTGLIDKNQFDQASAATIFIQQPAQPQSDIAPTFADYARAQAEAILRSQGFSAARLLARGNLQIKTTLDLDLQLVADCLLDAHLDTLAPACTPLPALPATATDLTGSPDSAALALIDVNNGQILSMAGDAIAPGPQPAIVLQPFVYMDAFLRRDYTPASMVLDLPRAYPGPTADLIYKPTNPDGDYRGPLNLRDAMAAALLPPAVQVASTNGMESVIQTARTLGFTSLAAERFDLDLLERGGAVSVLDTAYAYSVLASMGVMRGLPAEPLAASPRQRDPVAILRIETAGGHLLWSHDQELHQTVLFEPSLAYMVNDILADTAARQATLAQPDPILQLSGPAAVIDGMSGDKRGNWTVGYTPDLVLAVHSSRQDGAPLGLAPYERAGSAPIWRSLIDYAQQHLSLPPREWRAPADIEEYLVCDISGLLPATTDHCPTRREIVPAGSYLQPDNLWQLFEINTLTGQLATVNTPDDLRQEVPYFVPPDDLLAWWTENGKTLPPSSYSTDSQSENAKPVRLTAPADYAYLGATVDIAGSINRAGAQTWTLEYGAEVNPDSWFTISEPRAVEDNGEISASWQTALLSGIHTLRLTVTFADGSIETDIKLLTFDNTPPAITLQTSQAVDTLRFPADNAISLLADVRDNLTIERVEFYRDDQLLGVDRDWPHGFEYQLEGTGQHVFRAIAFDQVGNRAESELIVDVLEEEQIDDSEQN